MAFQAAATQIASIFFVTFGVALSLQVISEVDHEASGVYWMRLTNYGDVQYTGLMRIGDQQFKAIVDTGSFELVVLGVNCTACGSPDKLYNGSKSRGHVNTGFSGKHSYGSGVTYSMEVSDQVKIGPLKIPRQMFWEVNEAEMPILAEGSFQVILGVGPPSSIIRFAETEAREVHKEFKEYKKHGHAVTSKMNHIVEHYDELVTHAKNTTTVAENLRVQNMAVCLHKGSGSHGYYLWNDRAASQMPKKFIEIEVSGDIYWSANMTNFGLGSAPLEGNVSKAMKKAAKRKTMGCVSETCSAVIDTGTSLIVAPTEMARKVFEAMQEWIEAGGTCDDLSKLPDLEFNLNGKLFSLPAEAYVGEVTGELDEDMKEFMPHLYQAQHKLFKEVGCQPLIMTMDAKSQFGSLWILGMPFFRKYYTNFKFIQNIGKLSVPLASKMAFSVANSKCRPGHSPEEDTNTMSLLERSSTQRKAQLRVDASKLRISSLAHKVRAKADSNLLGRPHVRI